MRIPESTKKHTGKSQQIAGLDALRFAAAILVLCFHFALAWVGDDHAGAVKTSRPFGYFGWVGVEIFFVLSGFVITYSADGSTPWRFFQHRLTRLFPGVLVCATITAVVVMLTDHSAAKDLFFLWLKSIFFFPKGPWIDNSYWTLSIEVAFYGVIFALLCMNQMRRLPLVIGCIGGVSTAFWLVVFLPERLLNARFSRSMVDRAHYGETINFLLVRHGCYFAIGVLLWLYLFQKATRVRLILMLLCVVGGVLQICFRTRVVEAYSGFNFSAIAPVIVWIIALGAIVISVTHNEAVLRAIGPSGANLLRRLGLMTYPLYLLHATLGSKVMPLLRLHMSNIAALVITTVSVIALAYAVSVYVEPMLQRVMRQQLSRIG